MRNVAVSGDGRWVMAANYLPRNAVLFDADLNLVRTSSPPARWRQASRVSAVYDATPRRSFVVACPSCGRFRTRRPRPSMTAMCTTTAWASRTGRNAGVRRTRSTSRWTTSSSTSPTATCWAPRAPRQPTSEGARRQVVNLDVRPQGGRPADCRHAAPGLPGHHLRVERHHRAGQPQPERRRRRRHRQSWQPVKIIATPGPGFFMRSHETRPTPGPTR